MPVVPLTIAVIPGSDRRRWNHDACLRYRVLHYAPTIRPILIEEPVRDLAAPLLFQRPRDPALVAAALRRERPGQPVLADVDDLLWAAPEDWPWVRTGRMHVAEAKAKSVERAAALRLLSRVIVSTEPLAEALRELHPAVDVAVKPNALDRAWVEQGRAVSRSWRPGQTRIIRYLAGGSAHDADLASVGPVLREAMHRWQDLYLEVVGNIRRLPEGLPPGRVLQTNAVPYLHLPQWYASAWVTIAPLEDSRFNRCKSALKFLEAAAFACPCIATPIPDMRRCRAGSPLLAAAPEDWLGWFERLRDDGVRQELGLQAQTWVDAHAMAPQAVPRLLGRLRHWGVAC